MFLLSLQRPVPWIPVQRYRLVPSRWTRGNRNQHQHIDTSIRRHADTSILGRRGVVELGATSLRIDPRYRHPGRDSSCLFASHTLGALSSYRALDAGIPVFEQRECVALSSQRCFPRDRRSVDGSLIFFLLGRISRLMDWSDAGRMTGYTTSLKVDRRGCSKSTAYLVDWGLMTLAPCPPSPYTFS